MSKYFLAVLGIFKNEETILKEWIDHHLWQGVNHFYLIDNDSTDNYLVILQPYIDNGLVTLYHLPGQYLQMEHYKTVYDKIKDETEWLVIIDIDEYFFGLNETLSNYLNTKVSDRFKAILSEWYTFGSSGLEKQPESIRKSFIMRTNLPTDIGGKHKCIIRTSEYNGVGQHIHRCTPKNGQILDGVLFESDMIRLFHYQIMSKEYYEKVKMNRGDVCTVLNKDRYTSWDKFNEVDSEANIEDKTLINVMGGNYE